MTIKALFLTLLLTFSNLLSANELGEIETDQLKQFQEKHQALVIDIRTAQEWAATGTIPNSSKLEFFDAQGKFDADTWLENVKKLQTTPDQPIVLVCRSGNRSGMVGTLLTQKLGMEGIYHLKDGIMPWIKAGNPVTQDCSNQLACK